LLGEYDQQGRALREYVWLDDVPVAVFMPDPADPAGEPLTYFIHTDHLNTPRVVVDRQGRQRWSWLAEPFGTTAPLTNPAGLGDFTFNLRFPGQYADAESGLFYNWNRYYRSDGGDYTQSDPIGLAGGSLSTYSYVNGNPLSSVDPQGLSEDVLPRLLPVAVPSITSLCTGGPVACALAAAGIAGYTGGTLLYPQIAEPLGDAIEWCMTSESSRCMKVRDQCIAHCSETTLPTRDYGASFRRCLNTCMRNNGCKPPTPGEG
jgi:RHS repeat-associated protein